jgi:putative nucleotidyltransferase with HDIG domain
MDIRKLLIVDDEIRILESFSLLLNDLGFAVKTASNAEEALNLVGTEKFDIVFLDQHLGAAKGTDVMSRMSAMVPDLYFVIITANGNTDLAVDSLKKGASDFITKPFFIADLLKSINHIDKKRELEEQKKEMLATLELKLGEKTEELKTVYFSVLSSLAQAMEKKDTGTYGHSMRVRKYSGEIAAILDLCEADKENLKVAAMLHDIGKIGTSDFILGKPGKLDEDEMIIVKSHPQRGVEILNPLRKNFAQLENILPAILYHHESYDGSGYPEGRAGGEIPLLARIITVADTYDAILSNRPYRSGASHERAMNELIKCSGRQFDPEVVEAFVSADREYRRVFGNADDLSSGNALSIFRNL